MKQSIYLHREIVDTLRCFGELDEVINKILEEASVGKFDVMDKPPCPDRSGAGRYDVDIVLSIGSRSEEDTIARHLYSILRECDELNVEEIYSECFSTPRIGQAIMNRLLKAAGLQVINAVEQTDKNC